MAIFLEGDLEYAWPARTMFAPGPLGRIVRVLTVGLSYFLDRWLAARRDQLEKRWKSAGDFEVWPFVHRGDYEVALRERST
jgi:hypothetical protein